jgi:hypothetical protein
VKTLEGEGVGDVGELERQRQICLGGGHGADPTGIMVA